MYRAFLLLTIVAFFTSCGGDTQDTTTDGVVSVSSAPTENATTPETTSQSTFQKREAREHETPYCRLWVIKMAVETDKVEEYKGRWFRLKTDGSFENGKWGDTTNSGIWRIDEATNVINLAFAKADMMPGNWAIQGSGGGGRILWKGNVAGNRDGTQLMMEPETVLPNK